MLQFADLLEANWPCVLRDVSAEPALIFTDASYFEMDGGTFCGIRGAGRITGSDTDELGYTFSPVRVEAQGPTCYFCGSYIFYFWRRFIQTVGGSTHALIRPPSALATSWMLQRGHSIYNGSTAFKICFDAYLSNDEVFPHNLAPLVIEVFAGTARLSTVAGRMGFRTLAVDRSSQRSNFSIQRLDLTLDHDVQTLLDITNLEAHNIAWIHLEGYDELAQWLNQPSTLRNVQIVFLQETWRSASEFSTQHWHWTLSGAGQTAKANNGSGVAVLVNNKLASSSHIRYQEWVPGRLLEVRITEDKRRPLLHRPITLVCAYQHSRISHSPEVYAKRLKFLEKLQKCLDAVPARHTLILGGDINTGISPMPRLVGMGAPVSTNPAQDQHEWQGIVQQHRLCLLNTWGPPGKTATYVGADYSTLIDFLGVRERDQPVDAVMHPMQIDAILRQGQEHNFADAPSGDHFGLLFIFGVLNGDLSKPARMHITSMILIPSLRLRVDSHLVVLDSEYLVQHWGAGEHVGDEDHITRFQATKALEEGTVSIRNGYEHWGYTAPTIHWMMCHIVFGPLPSAERHGCPVPKPLRSLTEPQGLSTLTGADAERVMAANKLYRAVGRIVDLALQLHIFAAVENPLNSLFWLCDGLDHLCRRADSYQLIFDACMHGGDRDKTTLFWCSDSRYQSLALRCSRDHKHASWKPRFLDGRWQFPTAQEAAYPWLLCERMLYILADDYGARVTQRRLVPWGAVRVCAVSAYAGFDRRESSELLGVAARIAYHNLADFSSIAGEDKNEVYEVVGMVCDDKPCATQAEILTIGIPREPEDFVKAAVLAGHPRNAILVNRQGPAKEIAANVVMPADERRRRAEESRGAWKKIAEESAAMNAAFMKQKPTYLAKALEGKNVLAWKRILERNGFPDKMLWADLRDGFRLTGWMRETGIFKPRVKAPESSLENLLAQSSYRSPMTMRRIASLIASTKPDETAEKVWAETLEEERKGWIFEDTDPDFNNIVLAHRFGLEQKNKVRVIDNGKDCGLNMACGLPERFTLHGVDVLAAVFFELLNMPTDKLRRLVGKTIDLVSAYKFYPVHPLDRLHLRIGVFDTDSKTPRVDGTNVLPFGATGSVAGFLRVSAAIWHTGVRDMGLGWCAYFDDFPLLSCDGMEEQIDELADEVFEALGVQYAKEGKKATKFDAVFNALGLAFDLSEFQNGIISITHTVERRAEVKDVLGNILLMGKLSSKEAEVLRGRMHWYSSYLFGRAPCEAMHQMSLRARGIDGSSELGAELEWALRTLLEHVNTSRPLELRQTSGRELFVFTDGSYEPGAEVVAGIGGVIYDASGSPLAFFSSEVPKSDLDVLEAESEHPIYEVELYAVLVAFRLWAGVLKDTFSTFYLANEAAQSALIAGRSGTKNGRRLLQQVLSLEHDNLTRPWFGRVPTHSNPADAPSRQIVDHLIRQGARQDDVSLGSLL
ncbi:unnamed protein product [Symbiodinium sp. CCMP2592]|nr:unnamed protein product [Symbiodinium sp. CCMP2592]